MGNVNMEAYQIHTNDKDAPDVQKALDILKASESQTSEAVGVKADRIDIAPVFSTESAYSAGDIVYHSNSLYKFITDHAVGAWNAEEVEAINIAMAIKEGGGGGASGSVDYSTQEKEIGTWIDGKTLYEKTFVCKSAGVDLLTYANSSYTIDVSNIDSAFVYGVMARRTSQYQSKYIDSYNVTGEIQTVIDTTGAIYFPYASRFYDIAVTLRYTKS